MESRLGERGGQVRYRAEVEEVLGDGRATGVRLADGSVERAGTVVAAIDTHSALYDLLGGRHLDGEARERHLHWSLFRPFLTVSFGVKRSLMEQPPFHLLRLADPLDIPGKETRGLFLRTFNYTDAFAPPGCSVVQAQVETTWEYWWELRQNDKARYDAAKERVADAVLGVLEALFPGIKQDVEASDVATPYTMWRYTRNHHGSFEGWLPTTETLTRTLARTVPGLRNFYLAGQWMVPGGGVPPVLYSGRHVAQMMARRDRRPFKVAPLGQSS
jgi:phytoene dehydrogenase-like protein